MGGSFETTDDHPNQNLKTLHLPTLMGDLFSAAVEMVADLDDWELVSADEDRERGVLVCKKPGGLLAGTATITITLEAPDGIPSTRIHVKSVTEGGLVSRDKANVAEFVKPYNRRVC